MRELILLLVGLSGGLAAWAYRAAIWARYQRDLERMAEVSLRFNPEPVNVVLRVWGSYVLGFGLLAGLCWMTRPHPWFGLGLWLALLPVPSILVEMAWQSRRKEIDQQLPAAIAAMCNSIRAGLTLVSAIERMADRCPEPIRSEFRIMTNQYRYGSDLGATILEAKRRLNLPNFNLFASAILLNREMGGDVSETLSRISKSLEKLHEMRLTVQAHTSEGRANIRVLLVAPIIMLAMVSTVDPEGVILMFTTNQGYTVLIVAGILAGTGVLFANKITKTDI